MYFSNLHNRNEVLEAHVLINKTNIENNYKIVPYTDIIIATEVVGKDSKAIIAFAAGMTVIFTLENYSAYVLLSHGCWNEDIGGVFDGIGITFSNAPVRNISVTVTSSYFIHTILSRKVDAFRIVCLVTTNLNDKSTHNTSRNILTITGSIIDNYYDTTYVVTSNQYNHSNDSCYYCNYYVC